MVDFELPMRKAKKIVLKDGYWKGAFSTFAEQFGKKLKNLIYLKKL